MLICPYNFDLHAPLALTKRPKAILMINDAAVKTKTSSVQIKSKL
jgi:hypothetical protein